MGCFVSAIAVFAFFAFLLNSAQDMADEAKRARTPQSQIEVDGARSTTAPDPTAEVVEAARLTALLSAVRRYAKDHKGLLPPMESPEAVRAALFPAYVPGEGVFQTSHSQRAYLPNPALSGKLLKSFASPSEVIAFYEPLDPIEPEREKHRAVLFLDGSLRRLTPPEWDVLRKRAGLP
jgi:hypothetical protein